ncbi:MAG: hypothetical protein ACPGVD_06465 [Flavobacteriales bacterium]
MYRSDKAITITIISVTLTDMVRTDKKGLIISLNSKKPHKTLKELRKAIVVVTTVLIESDEWNYNPDLPEAVSSLIRLQSEMIKKPK